jgi:hypothetical protein
MTSKYDELCNKVKWVPVTTARRVLRLRMEERLSVLRVGANVLNNELRTDDKV